MTAASVTSAVTGAAMKLFLAAGARLKPIRATIAPATIGGIRPSIHLVPVATTIRPTIASRIPVTTIPNSADGIPCAFVAATIGTMNANDEPR